MPSRSNLPAVHVDGRAALATRAPLDPREALKDRMDVAIQALLAVDDPEFMRSIGVTKDGVVGSAHRGLMAHRIQRWGIENGDPVLMGADIDDIIRLFAWVRRRTPGIRIDVLIAAALQQLAAPTVAPTVAPPAAQIDPQAGL